MSWSICPKSQPSSSKNSRTLKWWKCNFIETYRSHRHTHSPGTVQLPLNPRGTGSDTWHNSQIKFTWGLDPSFSAHVWHQAWHNSMQCLQRNYCCLQVNNPWTKKDFTRWPLTAPKVPVTICMVLICAFKISINTLLRHVCLRACPNPFRTYRVNNRQKKKQQRF